jgi:HSP20 family molecular chaperone IbpA
VKGIKNRYSIPAKIVDLLYTDDSFFNEVMKIKKASGSRFPRNDEWRCENGFNMSFALAGYSSEDISVSTSRDSIIVDGRGLDSINPVLPSLVSPDLASEDAFNEYNKERKAKIHVGTISRGIARRKFRASYLISEEFDITKSEAHMENGLLHIFIPKVSEMIMNSIEVKNGS